MKNTEKAKICILLHVKRKIDTVKRNITNAKVKKDAA